jgi:hypothetical protein
VQEDVLGLDVAMDDAVPVCEIERAGDLSNDPDGTPLAGGDRSFGC